MHKTASIEASTIPFTKSSSNYTSQLKSSLTPSSVHRLSSLDLNSTSPKLTKQQQQIFQAIQKQMQKMESDYSVTRKYVLPQKATIDTQTVDEEEKDKGTGLKRTNSVLIDSQGKVVVPRNPTKAIVLFLVIFALLIGFGLMGEIDQAGNNKTNKTTKAKAVKGSGKQVKQGKQKQQSKAQKQQGKGKNGKGDRRGK